MKLLSISTAWNETSAFVRREAGLLFPIAFLLIALPGAFLQALVPGAEAGQKPEPGAWMLLFIPIALLGALGSLTITTLALGRETVVRDAFAHAFRRVLPLIGAFLLLVLAAMAVMIPLIVIFALVTANATSAALATMTILSLVFIWAAVRMMMLNPVATAEPLRPVALIKRSWALTRGYFWRLLGLMLVLLVLFMVLTLAVTAVGGIIIHLVAGQPQPGSLAFVLVLLLGAVLNTIFVIFFATLAARVYAQLASPQNSGI